MTFEQKLTGIFTKKNSALCIGLDPNPALIPDTFKRESSDSNSVLRFCESIIEVTSDLASAFKINTAYFESLGKDGFDVMFRVREMIPADCMVVADAKRGDVPHTSEQYNQCFFNHFNADAITLSPLMGFETLEAYGNDPSKALFVLALTSNPGAVDFFLHPFDNRPTLARYISEALCERQNSIQSRLGMVIGATQSTIAQNVLDGFPDCPLLIPGIGAQGGNLETLTNLLEGRSNLPLIAISRSIIYPNLENGVDYQTGVRAAAEKYHSLLNPLVATHV